MNGSGRSRRSERAVSLARPIFISVRMLRPGSTAVMKNTPRVLQPRTLSERRYIGVSHSAMTMAMVGMSRGENTELRMLAAMFCRLWVRCGRISGVPVWFICSDSLIFRIRV